MHQQRLAPDRVILKLQLQPGQRRIGQIGKKDRVAFDQALLAVERLRVDEFVKERRQFVDLIVGYLVGRFAAITHS